MVKKKKYKTVEELPVWQKAHELTLLVYKATEKFPKSEMYGLTSQIRRSSSSIGANISEGFSRNSTKELLQFLYNARGSCAETLYHLRLSNDLHYLKLGVYRRLALGYDEVGKQLNGWISSLRKRL
jgi:four helix bundle protein